MSASLIPRLPSHGGMESGHNDSLELCRHAVQCAPIGLLDVSHQGLTDVSVAMDVPGVALQGGAIMV